MSDDQWLAHVAGQVGFQDPFNANPREVFLQVRRIVREHEKMRKFLLKHFVEGPKEAQHILSEIDQMVENEEVIKNEINTCSVCSDTHKMWMTSLTFCYVYLLSSSLRKMSQWSIL